MPSPVALALDTHDLETAVAWAAAAGPYVSTVKVGLELFLRHGHDAVVTCREASGGRDVFLDLKLHDIPHTVAGAARAVADLAPTYLTVHAAGGPAMVRAAVEALPTTRVTGVTVLTSLSADALAAVGFADAPRDAVRRLAALAVEGGARALVCSPLEVADVRREVGADITLITPGVRPRGEGVTTRPGPRRRSRRCPTGPTCSSSAVRSPEPPTSPRPPGRWPLPSRPDTGARIPCRATPCRPMAGSVDRTI